MVYIRGPPSFEGKEACNGITSTISTIKESRPYLDLFFIIIIMTNYGCVCFWWKSLPKMLSGNEAVWLVRKILFSRNWNPLTRKKSLWPRKCFYTSIFPSKHFRKMRERGRERARARKRRRSSPRSRAPTPVRDRDRRRDRDPRSRLTVRSREGKIAIFARSRRRSCSRRTGNIFVVDDFFFLGCGLCFLICVFLLFFQTPENIFRKIFWNATKYHGNIFLFRKLAFPENMYFPENILQQPNTAYNSPMPTRYLHFLFSF